jgi:branched-chain amino acid aminotransferase
MTNFCNLDGAILREDEARIPVLDRGFLFGDSVYEVIRTRGGVPFAWQEHLDRLRLSAAGLALPLDLTDAALMSRVQATVAQAGFVDSYIRIIVTRGTGSAPNIDLACATGKPRWVIMVRELPAGASKPAHLAIVDRLRTDRRALDPALKSGNYLNNVLGLAEAKAAGATDCLFLNAAGFVTEASTANFFLVKHGVICTPPLTSGILAGITRSLLLAFCRDRGHRVVEQDLTAADVHAADELFLTSTLRDVMPVAQLDGAPFHGGTVGPFTATLQRDWLAHCLQLVRDQHGPALRRLLPQ